MPQPRQGEPARSMRAERRDRNEQEIVQALREAGCEVWQLCAKEPADLLVLHNERQDFAGVTLSVSFPFLTLLEVKDSAKPPSKRKLTAKQTETHKRWPVHVCETVEQALQIVRGGV